MEQYNKNRIRELMQEAGVRRADLKRALGIANETTILRYVNGEDIHVSRLLQLAHFFGKSIMDFIEGREDEQEKKSPPSKTMERKLHELEMDALREQMQLKIDYERKLAALERENELLREELKKRDGGAAHHSAVYVSKVFEEDAFSSKVAEEEK